MAGEGGDAIEIIVQDERSGNDSSFSTGEDGTPAELRIGVFKFSGDKISRDGAVDNNVIVRIYNIHLRIKLLNFRCRFMSLHMECLNGSDLQIARLALEK